jgi:hypothetical protein
MPPPLGEDLMDKIEDSLEVLIEELKKLAEDGQAD